MFNNTHGADASWEHVLAVVMRIHCGENPNEIDTNDDEAASMNVVQTDKPDSVAIFILFVIVVCDIKMI